MGAYLGLVALEGAIPADFQVITAAGVPVDTDSLPTFRSYGPAGIMRNGTGTAAYKDSGSVTAASNASPIVITSAGHGLSVGTRVTIAGVLGNTGANGTFTISAATSSTFSLSGSTGTGTYTSGGDWHVTGLYTCDITALGSDGYESGENYSLLVSGLISAAAWADLHHFGVT